MYPYFFSERMYARHDVAVLEQQLWSSRLLELRFFFPRTENHPVRQSAMNLTEVARTWLHHPRSQADYETLL